MTKVARNLPVMPHEAGSACPGERPASAATAEAPDAMMEAMRLAAADASRLLRTIGSPMRLMILCLLKERPCTVTDLCETMQARQSLISQHLARLRRDGLVQVERQGHYAHYSIADTVAQEIVDTLYRHYCAKGMLPPRQ
jgi:DNA-binding transcriptional ArsR family regulator